jgi:plasmid stabilization system protein ParE
MAQVIWTDPAITDLDAIADYIALENPIAATELIKRILDHIAKLMDFPELGAIPDELEKYSRYRHIVEPPCRIFYRFDAGIVFILHVMRSERLLRLDRLKR